MSAGMIFEMLKMAPGILSVLTVGGMVVGLPLAVIAYFFTYSAVQKYRHDIRSKFPHPIKRRASRK